MRPPAPPATALPLQLLFAMLGAAAAPSGPATLLPPPTPASQVGAVQGLLGRVLPTHIAALFELAIDPAVPPGLGGTDGSVAYFSLSNAAGGIAVTASGGVELASGCHYYLKFHTNTSFSWFGDNLANLPPAGHPLPALPASDSLVVRYTDDAIRFGYNDCFYAYSSMWWDWARWERELDFLALLGINTFGVQLDGNNDAAMFELFASPKFGNLSAAELAPLWQGPTAIWSGDPGPEDHPVDFAWIDSHRLLQQQIVNRARALGMTTVFKAWDGTVPPAFKRRFPAAQVQCHFGNAAPHFTCQLPSFDPMFASIAEDYLRVLHRLYGMDHGALSVRDVDNLGHQQLLQLSLSMSCLLT